MRSASKQYGKCNPEERKEDLPLQRRRRKEEEKEETNEAEKTCTDNGGTWDGSACTYPSTEPTEPTEPTTPEPTEPSTPGTDTSTDNTTGYVWFDRRNLYNIFDRL